MNDTRRFFWLVVTIFAFALTVFVLYQHNLNIVNNKKQQCVQIDGVPVETGRALRDWLCLDRSALKEFAK